MPDSRNDNQRSTPEHRLGLLTKELEETKTVLSALFDFSPFPMWISDKEGTCLQINQAMRTDWGVDDQDVVGKYNVFHDPVLIEQDKIPTIQNAYDSGKRITVELNYTPEQFTALTGAERNTYCIIKSTLSPIKNESGCVLFMIYQHNDLSAEKQLEEERNKAYDKLKLAQKLEAIGLLAAGVAHEINQPLTFIKSTLECNLRDLEQENFDKAALIEESQEAVHQVNRINRIIRQLRLFGRTEEMKIENARLDVILTDALILMRKILKAEQIKLTLNILETLPSVRCDANQFVQVFVNLFQNAIEALRSVDQREIKINMKVQGRHLKTEFIDNGPGISPELQEKIFDPFVSTKDVGEGSGLGLSIVYGIVQEHHGEIHYNRNEYESCFVMTLPVPE